MDKIVIFMAIGLGIMAVAIITLAATTPTSHSSNEADMITLIDSLTASTSDSEVRVMLYAAAWMPGAAEAWIKTHPEDFSNQVIINESMLVQSPALKETLQCAVEKKYDFTGPGSCGTIRPVPASHLNSIISAIGPSKFVKVYTNNSYEESRALVKYGEDYVDVTIATYY